MLRTRRALCVRLRTANHLLPRTLCACRTEAKSEQGWCPCMSCPHLLGFYLPQLVAVVPRLLVRSFACFFYYRRTRSPAAERGSSAQLTYAHSAILQLHRECACVVLLLYRWMVGALRLVLASDDGHSDAKTVCVSGILLCQK